MRHIIFLTFLCFSLNSFAQKDKSVVAVKDTAYVFSGVIKVDSTVTKDELFERARLWFADYYKDSKEVLQVADKQAGQLVGKGTYKTSVKSGVGFYAIGYMNVTVKIFTKDGRYRYEFSNYTHDNTGANKPESTVYIPSFGLMTTGECPDDVKAIMIPKKKYWEELQQGVVSNAAEMLASLKSYMDQKPGGAAKGDW